MGRMTQPGSGGGGGGAPSSFDVQNFIAAGAHTWNAPAGGLITDAHVIGAGGGGGGGARTALAAASSGIGGAGGALSRVLFYTPYLAGSEAVNVGAGGAASVGAGPAPAFDPATNGGNGGASTFGDALLAAGGQGVGRSGNFGVAPLGLVSAGGLWRTNGAAQSDGINTSLGGAGGGGAGGAQGGSATNISGVSNGSWGCGRGAMFALNEVGPGFALGANVALDNGQHGQAGITYGDARPGSGGAGGGSSTAIDGDTSSGGDGGPGGYPGGGGGGGGGMALNFGVFPVPKAGDGGAGANGQVVVLTLL